MFPITNYCYIITFWEQSIIFIAYKSYEVFFLTKNTQPKAPYPKGFMNSKSFNPISCDYLTLSALILTTSESEL
jgi:hypothetical protein